jgi:hypothetical protein
MLARNCQLSSGTRSGRACLTCQPQARQDVRSNAFLEYIGKQVLIAPLLFSSSRPTIECDAGHPSGAPSVAVSGPSGAAARVAAKFAQSAKALAPHISWRLRLGMACHATTSNPAFTLGKLKASFIANL